MAQDRENIIKALECCTSPDGDDTCLLCPYGDINLCTQSLMAHALSLINSQEQMIKELTEENERLQAEIAHLEGHREADIKAVKNLKEENERLIKYLDDHFPKCIYQYDGDVQEYCVLAPCGQFKTVAEFQKQIEADTVRKYKSAIIEYYSQPKYQPTKEHPIKHSQIEDLFAVLDEKAKEID